MLQACLEACSACGDECEKHGRMMAHCKVCADACRACLRGGVQGALLGAAA